MPPWHDHQIIQHKLRRLAPAADAIQQTWSGPGVGRRRERPTVNDELSYQGEGDRHTEADTVEAHLGAFLGSGYGTTGYKPGEKTGHYFWGNFDVKVPHLLCSTEDAIDQLVNHHAFQPHITPIQLFNKATDPFLPGVKPHLFHVLTALDERGYTNHVLVITRFHVGADDMAALEELKHLRLLAGIEHGYRLIRNQ